MGSGLFLDQSLPVISLELFALLIVVNGLGYWIGRRHSKLEGGEKREKIAGTITGAMLALLGFILAISTLKPT